MARPTTGAKACTGASAGPEPGVWLMVELGA